MNNIKTSSLAFMLFALFSISYLVTSVSAQMGSPDMGAPGTVCIPESAKDQTWKFGYKCMTPESIAIFNNRLEKSCREGIIKGHGKFRRGENDKRASKNTNINMMEEVMERTSHCLEKKSVQQCQERVLSGLHIDDDFCFPIAERFCGGTEDIRIKTDGSQHELGRNVKLVPELCAHYEIVPTQAAAIKRLSAPTKAQKTTGKQIRREEKRQRKAQKAAAKKIRCADKTTSQRNC